MLIATDGSGETWHSSYAIDNSIFLYIVADRNPPPRLVDQGNYLVWLDLALNDGGTSSQENLVCDAARRAEADRFGALVTNVKRLLPWHAPPVYFGPVSLTRDIACEQYC
jgi:hypothetical protein